MHRHFFVSAFQFTESIDFWTSFEYISAKSKNVLSRVTRRNLGGTEQGGRDSRRLRARVQKHSQETSGRLHFQKIMSEPVDV